MRLRSCASVLFIAMIGQPDAWPCTAQDVIVVKDEATQRQTRLKADVIEWNRETLVYSPNGRRSELPSRRVLDVQYARSSEHAQAEQFMQELKFAQAAAALSAATQKEPRAWIVREISAAKLRCAQALGQPTAAISEFLKIVHEEPKTRFNYLIPLAWSNRTVEPELLRQLQPWLDDPREVEGLIASSWLMATDPQPAAERLRQLSQSSEAWIAHLASAQLWRSEVITADSALVDRWQRHVARMPEKLRAGPLYLIGLAQQRLGQSELATITLMKLPILYQEHYQLCGDALSAAHRIQEAEGDQESAESIGLELEKKFGLSHAAAELSELKDSFSKER